MSKIKTSKKATKKAVKKDPAHRAFEKMEKEQKAFTKRMEDFTKDLSELSKRYKVKILAQGFDTKTGSEFITGGNIKNTLDRSGLHAMLKKSFE